jgi:hypothetical protein
VSSILSDKCDSASADDVLLLMEGTNDISNGISRATIIANLGIILDKATAKCFHGAVASTIRRLLAGTPIGSHLGDPNHPKTKNLKDDIKNGLAPSKNRAFVNPWGDLCPDQPCYNDKFKGRLVPNDPGHVNKRGYDDMAPLFHAVIVVELLPQAPTLTSPSGDVVDTTPAFTWLELNRADWYFLEVEESDGTPVYGMWHPEEGHAGDPALCGTSGCSFDPALPLPDGDYRWRVKARNLRGNGSWSGYSNFTVWTSPPGAASPMTPSGDIFYTTPTYTWTEASGAVFYELEVEDSVGGVETYASPYDASLFCGGGTCAVMPAPPAPALTAGDYTWRVRATNPAGPGTWTAKTPFTVIDSVPETAVALYPLVDVFDTTPAYRWLAAAGATSYDVRVDGSIPAALDGLDPAVVCSGSLCEVVQPTNLPVGAHTWQVRGSNGAGDGSFSSLVNYDVLTCSPTDLEVDDSVVPPYLACNRVFTAASGFTVGATDTVEFHAGDVIELGEGFEVLTGGSFTARVDY